MVRRVGLVTEGRLCCVEAVGGVIGRCWDCVVALVVGVVVAGIVGGVWLGVWGLVRMSCVGIGVRGRGGGWWWRGRHGVGVGAVLLQWMRWWWLVEV